MTNPLLPGGIVQRSPRLPLVQTGGKKMPRGTELPLHSLACVDFEAFPQRRTDCLLAAREASDGAIPNRMAMSDREPHRVERRHAGWSCRTTGTIHGSAQRAAEAGVLQHRQRGHAGISHPGSRLRSGDAQRRGGAAARRRCSGSGREERRKQREPGSGSAPAGGKRATLPDRFRTDAYPDPGRAFGYRGGPKRMSLFSALSIGASGMAAQRARAELLVENLANVETTRTPEGGPYRRKDAVFQSAAVESPF